MNVPRSVADVLSDHVVFEVECIDRMYCNVYIPGLQYAAGLVGYVHQQLGLPIASTAPLAKISDRFSAAVHRFAVDHGVPWVDFARGQRKEYVMDARLPGRIQRSPGRGDHRQTAVEYPGVPYQETSHRSGRGLHLYPEGNTARPSHTHLRTRPR